MFMLATSLFGFRSAEQGREMLMCEEFAHVNIMLREGHIGIGLLMYTPVGAVLWWTGQFLLFILGAILITTGATLPDIDTSIPIFKHRGWTHTVWFLLVTTILVTIGLFVLYNTVIGQLTEVVGGNTSQTLTIALFSGGLVALGIISHLLGDMITPRGIRPFSPVTPRNLMGISASNRKVKFEFTKASSQIANGMFLALGMLANVVVVVVL
jgi:inner membrane protein